MAEGGGEAEVGSEESEVFPLDSCLLVFHTLHPPDTGTVQRCLMQNQSYGRKKSVRQLKMLVKPCCVVKKRDLGKLLLWKD